VNVRFIVDLSEAERKSLIDLTRSGTPRARGVTRARILLMADTGSLDEEIVAALATSSSTVFRTRRRFVEAGLEAALQELPREGGRQKLSEKENALLVATACSAPPEGRARWTLELLADRLVQLTVHESVSTETVRRRLAESDLQPWRRQMWCIPKVDAEYVARMEDVLDLYAEPGDPAKPIVCFDESPKQLLAETRTPIPAEPGHPERVDHEYRRNGTVNLFVTVASGFPWRNVKVTDQRTNVDFAECMRDLVDIHFPLAPKIRVVLDNLNTHKPASLYEAFAPEEARRILRRLEFHFTPKHASWLNMAEIEIGVLAKQCLSRRIGDKEQMVSEVAAWQRDRNKSGEMIKWRFFADDARRKFTRLYANVKTKKTLKQPELAAGCAA
jgi:transposase